MYTFLKLETLIEHLYTETLGMEQMERIRNGEDLKS